MSQKLILKARGITKSFFQPERVDVLKEIDLDLYLGEALAIVGSSGEGKSTLLHILGTLEAPTSGRLEIGGNEIASTSLPELRNKQIGFVFQSHHLFEEETTLNNILMPAKIGRLPFHPGSPTHTRALKLLERIGLGHRAHFKAKVLSGGEKQRASVARALCNLPPLILADEPSGNLDHLHSLSLYDLLLESVKEQNSSLIVVTHDLELAARCDRTLQLKEGKLYNPFP